MGYRGRDQAVKADNSVCLKTLAFTLAPRGKVDNYPFRVGQSVMPGHNSRGTEVDHYGRTAIFRLRRKSQGHFIGRESFGDRALNAGPDIHAQAVSFFGYRIVRVSVKIYGQSGTFGLYPRPDRPDGRFAP